MTISRANTGRQTTRKFGTFKVTLKLSTPKKKKTKAAEPPRRVRRSRRTKRTLK